MKEAKQTIAPALGVYTLWVGLTYLLEGWPGTLLRPEALGLRLAYIGLANLGVGVVLASKVLARLYRAGTVDLPDAGFNSGRRSFWFTGGAFVAGFALYAVQAPPSRSPVVLLNGFAQVWAVSVAEVLVCWAVLGALVDAILRPRFGFAGTVGGAVTAAVAFGLYHFGHSPPFNTVGMVSFLTGIGLVTSLFFFSVRDVYATAVFHNFFAVTGVLQALGNRGALAHYEKPMVGLLVTAAMTTIVLLLVHRLWLRKKGSQRVGSPRRT